MKNTKRILLVCLFALLIATMFAMTAAAETFTGDVVKEDADNANDLVWTFDDATGIMTITGTSTELVLKPAPSWNTMGPDTIPWWDHVDKITKVVVEAPITAIGGCTFNQLKACTTIVFPNNSIKLKGSMTFANMWALATLGPDGTEAGTLDLRNFTGSSSQAFENSCKDMTIKVLMPEDGDSPMSTAKVFADNTSAIFVVKQGSACEGIANTIKETSEKDPDVTPYTGNVTVQYYGDESTDTGNTEDTKPSEDTNTPTEPETPTQTLQETKTATAAYGTPVIDGDIDDIWETATAIDFPWNRQDASVESLAEPMTYQDESQKPYAKMMWDANKLYVLAFVPDSDIQVSDSIRNYNRDGIEIYIDEPNEKKMTKAESSAYHQIQVVADGSFIEAQGAETSYTAKVYEGYYVIELAYTFHAVTPKSNLVIGYDISVNCNNTGNDVRDYCLSWNDQTNTTYYQPIYMGNLKLEGGEGVNEGVDTPSTDKTDDTTASGDTPATPGEVTVVAQGTVDEQYSKCTWVLTSDGTITFTANATGWNEVPYDSNTENRWYDYADQIKKAVIGKGLQKVGGSAFKNCVNLEVVEWASVGQLAVSAFENCPKLTTIYKTGNEPVEGVFDLSSISKFEGAKQFTNCGMTSVNLQSSLTALEENRFVDCVYLTNVTFGEKVEVINENAFAGCYNLKVIFGTKGGAAETFATAKGMTFAEVGADVDIPEAVVTTTAAPETSATPETTPTPETTTSTPESSSADDTTKAPDEAAQTSDVNLIMVAAFAIAALGAAVVLMRKRSFN